MEVSQGQTPGEAAAAGGGGRGPVLGTAGSPRHSHRHSGIGQGAARPYALTSRRSARIPAPCAGRRTVHGTAGRTMGQGSMGRLAPTQKTGMRGSGASYHAREARDGTQTGNAAPLRRHWAPRGTGSYQGTGELLAQVGHERVRTTLDCLSGSGRHRYCADIGRSGRHSTAS